jgi:2-deoxy-D-gluconate 3-dehydrogenase
LTDIDPAVVDSAKKLSENGGAPCYGIVGNLADRKDTVRLFDEALALLGGRLDILVNSAGIQRRHKSEEFPIEDWDAVLEVNLTAVFRMCQLAGRVMLKQGSGRIINVASMLAFFGGYIIPAYAASKAGVAQITKAFSNEWAARGIGVNCIAPGYMDTEMNVGLNKENNPQRYEEITSRIPMGRWGTGEDMKYVAVFLASEASKYLSGAVIPVDGGYLGK